MWISAFQAQLKLTLETQLKLVYFDLNFMNNFNKTYSMKVFTCSNENIF